MVEWTALEMRRTLTGTLGSNPSSSARIPDSPHKEGNRTGCLLLFRIIHILGLAVEEDFLEVATGFETSHRKVVQQPVSAILRCGSGYFALEFCYETEGLLHEFEYV